MAEFTPIDPAGLSDRSLMEALADGINRSHDCLDGLRQEHAQFAQEQGAVNAEAQKRREAMNSSIQSLGGRVTRLSGQMSGLRMDQEITKGQVNKLAQLFGAEKVEKGQRRPKGKGLATWPAWKAITGASAAIAGAAAIYKLLFALAPAGVGVLLALHHYLLSRL